MAQIQPRRRQFLTDPNTPPYVWQDASAYTVVLNKFVEYTGIPVDQLFCSPAYMLPMPIYEPTDNRRPWAIKPEAMWHPLFWLPDRLAYPLHLNFGDHKDIEYPVDHGIRVFHELTYAAPFKMLDSYWVHMDNFDGAPIYPYGRDEDGEELIPDLVYDTEHAQILRKADAGDNQLIPMYDPETGTWLDIPSLVGVDLMSEEGVERMRLWLLGQPDEALDSINLDTYMQAHGRDENWAANSLYRAFDGTLIGEERDDIRYVDTIRGASECFIGSTASEAGRLALELWSSDNEEAQRLAVFTKDCLIDYLPMPRGNAVSDLVWGIADRPNEEITSEDIGTFLEVADFIARNSLPDAERYSLCSETLRRDIAYELVDKHGYSVEAVMGPDDIDQVVE